MRSMWSPGSSSAWALEGGAQAEDRGERVAQVVGDEGEELVLVGLEVVGGRDVADDALEADELVVARAGLGARCRAPGARRRRGHGELEALRSPPARLVDERRRSRLPSTGHEHVARSGAFELRRGGGRG